MNKPLEQTVCQSIVDAIIKQSVEDNAGYHNAIEDLDRVFKNDVMWKEFWSELEQRVHQVYEEQYREQ